MMINKMVEHPMIISGTNFCVRILSGILRDKTMADKLMNIASHYGEFSINNKIEIIKLIPTRLNSPELWPLGAHKTGF